MKATSGLLALYLLLLAGLGVAGHRYYSYQQQRNRDEARNQLVAVADLKVAQIVEWRRERIADGQVMQANSAMVPVVERLLAGSSSGGDRAVLVEWLSSLKLSYGYANAMLIDPRQSVLLSMVPEARIEAPWTTIVREAMRSARVSLTDLHRDSGSGAVHLALIVPVVVSGRKTPIGAFVLWIDPNTFLYPHLQSWPTPSRTAETLLVRREGDQVLYLNELRHRQGTALRLSLPVGPYRGQLPAADVVSGREGSWNGVDYRGTPVLAAARRVPDSSWYLVAKVDADEIEAPIQRRLELVAIVLLLSVLAAGPAVGLVWVRQRGRLKTVRRESEVARHALVEHFSYLSRYANDIILLEDQSGRIVEANERAEQSYRYDRGELLALNVRHLYEPSSLAGYEACWEAAAKPGGILFETTHRRQDGSLFPVEVSARVIEVDGERFRQSIVRDIGERKRAAAELNTAHTRLEALWSINSLIGVDSKTLCDQVLSTVVRMTGSDYGFYGFMSDDESVMTIHSWSGEAMRDCSLADKPQHFPIPEAGVWGEAVRHRTPLILNQYSAAHAGAKGCPEGHVRLHNLLVVPAFTRGKIVSLVAVANRDADYGEADVQQVTAFMEGVQSITERKRAREEIEGLNRELEQRVQQRTAELEASNKELEAFTYSVSHDLRAPLRAMHGFSRLLEAEQAPLLSPRGRHHLEVIRRNALQMGNLIDSLLALSRLGRQPLRTQTVAPAALARQVWEELAGEREQRQVEFVVGELPSCTADPALLKQVLANLLGNALKYTRRRESARVEIGCLTMENSFVYWVRDNGAGFDMRYSSKLFGVFQRLHSQAEFEGSGIGLAIAQRIVQRHGGRIWAEAKLDEGATFYFTIEDADLGGAPRQDQLTKEPKS